MDKRDEQEEKELHNNNSEKVQNVLWTYEKGLGSNAQKDMSYVTELQSKSRF